MLFPFDFLSWDSVFYAVVVVILMLPFIYDGGRDALTYHGKFFSYYFLVSLSSVAFSFFFAFNAKNVKNCWYAADLLKHMSSLVGIRWELRDMKNMIKDGAIIVANHQSSLDLLGMFEMWRIMGKCTAIAKKELFYFWPFGLCAWLAGVVFIDRSSASKAYSTLMETAKLTQRDKTKIFFFPEGTRNNRVNKTKKLLPFKRGAFKMAIHCQVPVIPVVFSPYYFINSDERYFGQGKVIVKSLQPIPTRGLTEKDVESLMQQVCDAMGKAFEELYQEVVSTLPEDHYMRQLKSSEKAEGLPDPTEYDEVGKCVIENGEERKNKGEEILIKKEGKKNHMSESVLGLTSSINDTMWIPSNFLEGFYLPATVGSLLFAIQYRTNSTFRYYAKFTYFSLHSAFFATVFLPIMFFRPRSWRNALMPAFGLRLIKRLFGLRWKVTGHENIVRDSGSIVLINHQSIIDLIVLAEMWPIMDRCTVLSKKEIFYLGPFGLASYLWGTIFIDRLNPDKAKDTINKTGETVKKRKAKLLMFPEGTRHGGDELLPFKKGAFHVAIASKVPIQPVVVSKYYYLDYKKKRFDSGYTQIDILPPISTEGYTKENIDELLDKTYKIMMKRYQELNAEVKSKVENGSYDLNENTDKFLKESTESNHADASDESNLRHIIRSAQSQAI